MGQVMSASASASALYSSNDPRPTVAAAIAKEVVRLINLGFYNAYWPGSTSKDRVGIVSVRLDGHRLTIRAAEKEHTVDLLRYFILCPEAHGWAGGKVDAICHGTEWGDSTSVSRFVFWPPVDSKEFTTELEASRQRIDAAIDAAR